MKNFVILFLSFVVVALTMGAKNDICNLPPAADGDGVRACLAYMPSFSYHPQSNECKSFVYGGCGGNANRFGSIEECEEKCKE